MLERIHGIVTGTVRHNDRHDVLTLFTRERGRVAMLVPAGGGRSGRMRRSRLMPLSVIEADINFSPSRNLPRLGAFTALMQWPAIYSDPAKQAIAFFVAELIGRLTREAPPDVHLWDFVAGSLRVLEGMERGVANFHIIFLASLAPFLGVQPDTSRRDGAVAFDLRGGCYTSTLPPHGDVLTGADMAWPESLSRLSYVHAAHLRLGGQARRALLDGMLRYYSLHFPGVGQMKSPEVLSALFR